MCCQLDFEFSVGIKVFVIELSQISSSSLDVENKSFMHPFLMHILMILLFYHVTHKISLCQLDCILPYLCYFIIYSSFLFYLTDVRNVCFIAIHVREKQLMRGRTG